MFLHATLCLTLCVGVLNAAFACSEEQITLPDNSCVDVKFTITATPTSPNTDVTFNITAMGTFYIDWGDNSSDAVQTLPRDDTSLDRPNHRYSQPGEYKIRFGGVATGYADSDTTAAISFQQSNAKKSVFTAISGRLDTLFPVLGTTANLRPKFYRTFYNCAKLTSVPENLFRNISDAYNYTFYQTFYGCSGLKGFIPPSTFGGLIQNGHPYGTQMMASIFSNATNMDTSCKSPHRTYTTGYESYWNSRVSCATEYQITYELDGGTNYAGAPTTFWDDSTATINGIPAKPNNVFIGWCTDAALTDCTMTQTIPIYSSGTKTFYAKWQPCQSCAAVHASCSLNVVNNTCTYTTECDTGYDNIQNNGAYNAICYSVATELCPGGYYRDNFDCVPVGPGYYSAADDDTRSQCPQGLTTIGYGTGADEINDCGRVLHVDGHTVYLRQDKKTSPALHVSINNDVYYANMSTNDVKMTGNNDNYLKMDINGMIYSVYDDSGAEYTTTQ